MLEISSDDLFLPPCQEDMVDKLLSSETPDEDLGLGLSSLAEALLPLDVEPSSPSFMPWVCSTRYKTELCTNYASTGFCLYAKRCQFAHGLHELHVPSRHPKYKTALCHSYHSVGKCAYGTRCLFVHSPMEQRPSSRRHHKNIPCRNLKLFGVCPYGTGCNFLHIEDRGEDLSLETPDGGGGGSDDEDDKFKSTPGPLAKGWKPRGALCRTFSAFGFCVYGTRCLFQHRLPNKMNDTDVDQSPGDYLSPMSSRALSPSNDMLVSSPFSATSPTSSSSTPPSTTTSPLNTPTVEPMAHNAFTFSSQHLNDFLLPLACQLQRLESSQAMAGSTRNVWNNRSL